MPPASRTRVGYVLKMYPRLSETFIVNEILAHEAAGLGIDIFSLRAPVDGRFHESLGRVRAEVTYIPHAHLKPQSLWDALREASRTLGIRLADLEQVADADDVIQAAQVAMLARQRGLTHLHAHFATAATTVAMLASRMSGIPYSFTAHAKDIFHESVREDDLRAKLSGASTIVTVSDFNLEFLRSRFGSDARRVVRIYNGLDLDEFAFQSPEQREPTVIGVGRLVEKKGFEDLILAMALLKDRNHTVRCQIVGGGPLRQDLEQQITRLGLGGSVQLLGPRPREEVIERVQSAALLAAPCIVGSDGNRDGLPTVLLEAMALGTPCVATPVTGIPEAVIDERTGLIVPESDPQRLADAIERLVDDSQLRARLARAARAHVEANFDIHANTARMRRVCLAAGGAPASGVMTEVA